MIHASSPIVASPGGVHPTWYVANSYLKYPSDGITIPVDSSSNYVVYIGSWSQQKHLKKTSTCKSGCFYFQLSIQVNQKNNKHLPFIQSTMVALLHLLQYHDLIGIHHRAEAMGDDQTGGRPGGRPPTELFGTIWIEDVEVS